MNYTLKDKYDVIVIGSGMSGLTSALLFANKGKKAAVFEQSLVVAPLLAGFNRQGVHFETGFHYSGVLGKDEAGGYMFKKLGLDVPVEACDPDGYDNAYLVKSKRVFKIPSGYERLEKRLIEFFPHEEQGIKKYLSMVREEIKGKPFLNFHKKWHSNEELFQFLSSGKTLDEVLNECFTEPELKTLLSFTSVLYGVPPKEASFMLHCCCSGIMYESAWKLKGGGDRLVDIFIKALKEKGTEIFTDKKVLKIEENGAIKKVICADGSHSNCDICVSAVHPKEFIKIAPQGVYRKKNIERINTMKETRGFFMLFGVIKGDFFGQNVNNAGFLDSEGLLNGFKDFMYVNVNSGKIFSRKSSENSRVICAVLSVDSDEKFWNIPENEYKTKKEKFTNEIKTRLDLQWPGISKNIKFIEASTPRTFKRYVNYYGSYGIMRRHNYANVIPITKVPGLFLVGQSIIAPGLVGAMISAFLLDKLIDRQNDIKENISLTTSA
ncbi:MAG: NAD(P)/FAD-dependent oxidoreductase [Endomicrobium sp.]|nr:NAD(P)/FAD-dependent oxidoreductase [Endomicrobium sp.]